MPAPAGVLFRMQRLTGQRHVLKCRARAEGRMAAGPLGFEESPDSLKQRCRVTPGRGNPTDSATEIKPPRLSGRFAFGKMGKGETVG